jgi:hypothetical protein
MYRLIECSKKMKADARLVGDCIKFSDIMMTVLSLKLDRVERPSLIEAAAELPYADRSKLAHCNNAIKLSHSGQPPTSAGSSTFRNRPALLIRRLSANRFERLILIGPDIRAWRGERREVVDTCLRVESRLTVNILGPASEPAWPGSAS